MINNSVQVSEKAAQSQWAVPGSPPSCSTCLMFSLAVKLSFHKLESGFNQVLYPFPLD